MMINEALLCLQEGIVSSPRDGDVGAILGLGFPPFQGGPFRYIDHVGTGSVLKKLEELRKVHGNRYKPAELLVEMEAKGKRFYPIAA